MHWPPLLPLWLDLCQPRTLFPSIVPESHLLPGLAMPGISRGMKKFTVIATSAVTR
jgi:hypothetical protein